MMMVIMLTTRMMMVTITMMSKDKRGCRGGEGEGRERGVNGNSPPVSQASDTCIMSKSYSAHHRMVLL
jgi:hypothetical protein